MSWLLLWSALQPAIEAWLMNVARFERLLPVRRGFERDINPVLLFEARSIRETLREIASDDALGDNARSALGRVEQNIGWRLNGHLTWPDVQTIAFYLTTAAGALKQEATATEAPRRNRVERAFEHLNRSLLVDDQLKFRWLAAFDDEREEACERLGAVHLLSHGIFAFKAHAEGGRTDLVLGGQVDVTAPAIAGSEVLALTEWKMVRKERDRQAKAKSARIQADHYARGVLAGVELRATRFVVLVSRAHGAAVPDEHDEDVIYRHINVVIDSASPSIISSGRSRTRGRTR